MPPRKQRRACTATTPGGASATGTLPVELLLEIAARSDAATLFRWSAACKPLRREILSRAFLRRVCCGVPDGGIVPPRLLGFLGEKFSLVHPATPAAASFAKRNLAPFVSRVAADLLQRYVARTSRGGLVLLERRDTYGEWRRRSQERARDMCVYDPMTGGQTFLPLPPDYHLESYTYVLLTSFLLFAADLDGVEDGDRSRRSIRVRTLSSDAGGKWGVAATHAVPLTGTGELDRDDEAVVLGGVVHWLVEEYVLTYDVATATVGKIRLPRRCKQLAAGAVQLGSTPDGKLRLFGPFGGFTVCSWVMSPGDGWSRRAKVDTLATVRSLSRWGTAENDDDIDRFFFMRYDDRIAVQGIGDQRSGVALLRLADLRFVLDMDTREICKIRINKLDGFPYVVDLPSRLSTMKIF